VQLGRRGEALTIGAGLAAIVGLNALLGWVGGEPARRLASALGVAFLLGGALLLSRDRRAFPVRTVLVGLALQIALALIVLRSPVGRPVFETAGLLFKKLMDFSLAGASFVFGGLSGPTWSSGFIFAIQLFAIIVFMGTLSRVLYYLGIMQLVVRAMAWVMRRLMRASGAESLAAAANVFVGMVEAPLMARPYVPGMTTSELFCVMTAGMATVAGSVMAFYADMLKGTLGGYESAAAHLLTASVMSAPAAVLVAKVMLPETGRPATLDSAAVPASEEGDSAPINVMDAAARGALEGMNLALSVVGMLVAFVALVEMANALVSWATFGRLSFQTLLGYLCSPVAIGMGLPPSEAVRAGMLIGEKTVLNEAVAYRHLAELTEPLSARSALVMTYALCGFANFGSVAIMIAGVGGMAPNQRPNLARLGLASIASGSIAAFMTGCLVGALG